MRMRSIVAPSTCAESRIASLEAALANVIIRLGIMGEQIASLQMSMPKGIDHG